MILRDKLDAGDIIVLDGAIGTEIRRLGGQLHSATWAGTTNKTHPDVVRRVHEEFIRAGADVVTANTYSTCRHVLEGAGLGEETVAINRRAIALAREARDRVAPDRPVAIAGAMSNTYAWLEDGFTPDPRHVPTPEQEAANLREMAETLADAGADLLILEMMKDVEHAARCLEAAVATGLPVWVGMSATQKTDNALVGWDIRLEQVYHIDDGRGSDETLPLAAIIEGLKAIGGDAFGIMHSSIATTTPALEMLFDRWDGPVMAYPEAVAFNPETGWADKSLAAEPFAEACRGWVESGVQIIGGCCGATIEHIRAMVDALPDGVGPRRAA